MKLDTGCHVLACCGVMESDDFDVLGLAMATEVGGDGEPDDGDLFAELYPGLRRFAAVVAPLDLDPDDLLQEAVARCLRVGALCDLDEPNAYIRQTIYRVVANHNRTRGRERRATRRVATQAASEPVAYPSDLQMLESISAADRAALFLSDVERLAMRDVAAILGVSVPATRARVSRARRRLRAALKVQDQSDSLPDLDHQGVRP